MYFQGRGQGRVPGVPEPPHLSYDHVYNFKRKHLSEPPFGITREEIFASEEQEKKINLKIHRMLYPGTPSRQNKN